MKIQVVSDLHLEFSDVTIANAGADVLVLAGDILLAEKLTRDASELGQRFQAFLSRVCDSFSHVLYVAGNHEFYGGNFHGSVKDLRQYCQRHSNLTFLEDQTVEIQGVTFLGTTLWTDLNRGDPMTALHIQGAINDYRAIRNDAHNYRRLYPRDTLERHNHSLAWLRQQLGQTARPVVITHHSPSYQSITDEFRGDYLGNGAYHSDLDGLILEHGDIPLWIHGHTHRALDYHIGSTRIFCNPRGYENHSTSENTGWDPTKVLAL